LARALPPRRFGSRGPGDNALMARKKREPGSQGQAPTREKRPPDALRGGAPDVVDVRAKNSGHRKKTADKWNQ
jgi:hypothetical protein